MENLPPNRGMWNQEYTPVRLSQSFRSAKPFFDRKRPLENAAHFSNPFPQRAKESSMGTESVTHHGSSFNRIPLMELSANNTPYKRLKPGIGSDSNVNSKLNEEEATVAAGPALINSMPEECSKYMQSLNDRQRDAASSNISTPLMVIAGPGSGKTSTMVGRVLVLLNEGLHPSNILAMTFTTAATSEMRERIGKSAGKKAAKEITISTFHSFSLQLCRMHAEECEPFSTYTRTYDFIHVSGIESLVKRQDSSKSRCSLVDLMVEMDRVLHPEGNVLLQRFCKGHHSELVYKPIFLILFHLYALL